MGEGRGGPGGEERWRLFVALELPEVAVDEIVRWRAGVLDAVPALRPVGRENLHVTLCFLGHLPAAAAGEIAAAVADAAAGSAIPLRLGAGIWLPRRAPRLLAVTVEDPSGELARRQARVSDALAAGGWYEPERRPFLAHVTVARVRRDARVRAAEPPPPEPLDFAGARVTLYRSRLGREGARYEAVGAGG